MFISDTKAYFLDAGQSQIIVWNPEQMVVIGAVPLTVAQPAEGLTPFSFRSTFIDGLLVAYNSYLNDQGIRAARSDSGSSIPQRMKSSRRILPSNAET